MKNEKTITEIENIKIPSNYNLIEVEEGYILSMKECSLGRDFINAYGYNFYISGTEYKSKFKLNTLCKFSEIGKLYPQSLISNINYTLYDEFSSLVDDSDIDINENFSFPRLFISDKKLTFEFWFSIYLENYKDKDNPLLRFDKFYNSLKLLEYITNLDKHIEDALRIDFNYEIKDINRPLIEIFNQVKEELIEIYEKSISISKNDVQFETIFNLPKGYQSVLKPYLLYFEEFLNDLCIESDVNIQKTGENTILSVEPKNKDEALEKIAEALKAYLCAPVIAEGVSMEESLQMKTALTKLYAQCKNLESQMMYKELTLKEQNNQLVSYQKKEVESEDIINESKRLLVEAGVDTSIITQKNTILLDSLKSIKINNKEIKRDTFFSSIKSSIKIPMLFKADIELKRTEYDKDKKK